MLFLKKIQYTLVNNGDNMLNIDFKPGIRKNLIIKDFKINKNNPIDISYEKAIGSSYELEYLLNLVNEKSTLYGFLGSHPLNSYEKLLPKYTDEKFIRIKDSIYEEIKIISERETTLYKDIRITKEEITDFINNYHSLLKDHKLIVTFDRLAGNLPDDIFENLLRIAKIKNKEFYMEITKEDTLKNLKAFPDFAIISDEALELLNYMYPTTLGIVNYLKSIGIDKFILNKKSDGYIINLVDYMKPVEVDDLNSFDNLGLMAGILISKLKRYNIVETLNIVDSFYYNYNKYQLEEIDMHKIKEHFRRNNG